MKICELFEAKKADKIKVSAPKPRNFVAKNAKTSGAGSHTTKGYKRTEKHKKPPEEA